MEQYDKALDGFNEMVRMRNAIENIERQINNNNTRLQVISDMLFEVASFDGSFDDFDFDESKFADQWAAIDSFAYGDEDDKISILSSMSDGFKTSNTELTVKLNELKNGFSALLSPQ